MISSSGASHLALGKPRRGVTRLGGFRKQPMNLRTTSGCFSDSARLTTTMWLIGTHLCFSNQAFSSAATSANSGFRSG